MPDEKPPETPPTGSSENDRTTEDPSDSGRCSLCGKVLPEGAASEPCPKCLAALDRAADTSQQATQPPPLQEKAPSQIGPYKILEKIGEGGMGVVYLAEQERPLRRRVALKLIKLGMDTNEVLGQELEYGGLSDAANQRLEELMPTAELALRNPPSARKEKEPASSDRQVRDKRIPPVGTVLLRRYKDQSIAVTILENGFEWEGRQYSSLSALAKEITGSHWNGLRFFNLDRKGAKR